MGQPKEISRTGQLLVEGDDSRNFFEAFAERLRLSGSFQIQDFGGVNDLQNFLKAFVKMPDFGTVQSIGIARDAERSENGARQSVLSAVNNAGLPTPTWTGKPSAGGLTVKVPILPGGGKSGMRETLLCRTFAAQEVNSRIDDFFKCVNALPNASISKPDKARAHAYLATTRNPHHSVGMAAKAGVWNLDHAALEDVRAFLTSL